MSKYTIQQIEDMAELIHDMAPHYNEIAIDLIDISKELGFSVYSSDFNKENISGMVISSKERKAIYLSSNEAPARKRFTLAHEIGHIVLHHDLNSEDNFKIVDYRGVSSETLDTKEHEANVFAAALLMPKDKARKIWNMFRNIDDFASEFKVSKIAATIRLQSLGLI